MKNQTSKLINVLSKSFTEIDFNNNKEINKVIKKEKQKGFMDSENICMVVPKKERLKEIFKISFDSEEREVPKLKREGQQSCKYSVGYLELLIKLLKARQNDVEILFTSFIS